MAKRINLNDIETEIERDKKAFKRYRENLPEEPDDWDDASVDGVTVNGEPLDGNYFGRLLDSL